MAKRIVDRVADELSPFEAGAFVSGIVERIHRIGGRDHERLGAVRLDLVRDGFDQCNVLRQHLHAVFDQALLDAGGIDDDIRSSQIGVVAHHNLDPPV